MIKKILIVSSEFPPLPGGIGNHAYHLVKRLQQSGYEMSVLTDYRHYEKDIVFDSKQPFQIHRIERDRFTYLKRVIKAFSLISTHDIVIASGKFSLWMGAFMKTFFSKKKYIAVLHGSEILAGGKWSRLITKWAIKRYDEIIAVSQFTKDLALQQNKKLNIKVINNGFSLHEDSTLLKSNIKGKPIIVTVGNVTFRKGQQNVISVLPVLKKNFPEIHYHIIGIPTEQRKFEELANQLKVEDCVTFHGVLTDSDLKNIVSQADVFFMLSEQLENGDVEGFGIAVVEANYLGVPAIGSRNSGIADAIKDKYSGRLVSPQNSQEIEEAFFEIMTNYKKYAEQAQIWSKEFDWSKVIKKYLEVIES